jgi:dienelactone hydrolase
MPYYGPRRDPDSPRRMISSNPRETVEGMTQAVLDIRRGVAWLEGRTEVDPKQIGIFGISLGGITAALSTTAEPRLRKSCLVLAGGNLAQVALESPRLARERKAWEAAGGSREEFLRTIATIDPVKYADNVVNRRILMLNAKRDEVIPRASTEQLWKAFGRPEIVWYSGGHYSVALHLLNAMDRVTDFFQPTSPTSSRTTR